MILGMVTKPMLTINNNEKKTSNLFIMHPPILAHINDDADMWAKMWQKQVSLGCIPYYMFVVRDTGAQQLFWGTSCKGRKDL